MTSPLSASAMIPTSALLPQSHSAGLVPPSVPGIQISQLSTSPPASGGFIVPGSAFPVTPASGIVPTTDPGLGRDKKVTVEVQERLTRLTPPSVNSAFRSSGVDWTGYACYVDGWRCTLKTTALITSASSSSNPEKLEKEQNKLRREIAILEQLPWHPNIIKYLFHDRVSGGVLRMFTQWHDTSLSYCLHMRRMGEENVERRLQDLQNFLHEALAEDEMIAAQVANAVNNTPEEHAKSIRHSWQRIHNKWRQAVESSLRDAVDDARRKLRQEWGWLEHQASKLLLDLVRGVELLHRHRIIHRDLCPDNIFVSGDGDSLSSSPTTSQKASIRSLAATAASFASGEFTGLGVKYKLSIANFFLAKRITRNDHATTVVGSVRYRAPEVLWAPKYDFAADIWSIGMIAYTLATGLVPFEDTPDVLLPTIIASGERPVVPDEVARRPYLRLLLDIFHECTHLKPEERPQILEIKEALTLSTFIGELRAQRKGSSSPTSEVTFNLPVTATHTPPSVSFVTESPQPEEDDTTLPMIDSSTSASATLKQYFKSRYCNMREVEREKEKKRLSIFQRVSIKLGSSKEKERTKGGGGQDSPLMAIKNAQQPPQLSSSWALGNDHRSEMQFLIFFNDIHLADFYFFQCVSQDLYARLDYLPRLSLKACRHHVGRLEGPSLDVFVKESKERSDGIFSDPLAPGSGTNKFYQLGACGHAISTYPFNPLANCRLGDPICDRFEFVRFSTGAIAAVADGCNWGIKPRIAAERACKASVGYLEDNCKNITSLEEAAFYLLRAVAVAQSKIVAGQSTDDPESGTTTLLCSLLLPLPPAEGSKNKNPAPSVFIWASVGDCKAYLYSPPSCTGLNRAKFIDLSVSPPKYGLQLVSPPSSPPPLSPAGSPSSSDTDMMANAKSSGRSMTDFNNLVNKKLGAGNEKVESTKSSSPESTSPITPNSSGLPSANSGRQMTDPGGRLGFYSPLGQPAPDLRNLTIDWCMVQEGEIVVLLSDGVHDNLDPKTLGEPPSNYSLDSWDAPGATEIKRTYAENLALRLIKKEVQTALDPSATSASGDLSGAREDDLDESNGLLLAVPDSRSPGPSSPSSRRKHKKIGGALGNSSSGSLEFSEEDQVEPIHITRSLLNHCLAATAEGRNFMEQNSRKPCIGFSGKCDHATCLAFSSKTIKR